MGEAIGADANMKHYKSLSFIVSRVSSPYCKNEVWVLYVRERDTGNETRHCEQ